MIYKGYEISTGWPLGQPMKVTHKNRLIKSFPFGITDETIMRWIDKYSVGEKVT